jgi:hypothetical protein
VLGPQALDCINGHLGHAVDLGLELWGQTGVAGTPAPAAQEQQMRQVLA